MQHKQQLILVPRAEFYNNSFWDQTSPNWVEL